MSTPPLTTAQLLRTPANFIALGAGTGLAPRAPGTVGTLLGIPLLWLMPAHPLGYLVVLAGLFAVGVVVCAACARDLGVHDHGGIVWDEVVGYLATMFLVPREALWIIAGFVVFRLFDILKPWPIGWVDRRVHGGLGIMLDDVLAAVFAAVVLQLALVYFG